MVMLKYIVLSLDRNANINVLDIYDFSQIIVIKLASFRRSFEGVCPAPNPHPGHPTPLTIEAVWDMAHNFPVFQLLQVDMDASRNNVTPPPRLLFW